MSSVTLSLEQLRALSPATRAELARVLFCFSPPEEPLPDGVPFLAELTEAQAFDLIDSLNDRTVRLLRRFAGRDEPEVYGPAVVADVGPEADGSIRGASAAGTRRTRSITGDPNAYLWWWGNATQSRMMMAPATRLALRAAFAEIDRP